MQHVTDLHVHSPYSRACSKNISLESLSETAKLKGLNLLGSGDFTHTKWLEILKSKLREIDNTGIYSYNDFNFLLSTEVCNIFESSGVQRKVHNLIFAENFEIVGQINEQLGKHGNLESDGRPILNLSCAEMVEILNTISNDIMIISAHFFTPWFGVLGSKSGFDSIKECYEDQTKNIHALETGLSSDPAMAWKISWLDDFTLLSFSDAHSTNIWRLGREFSVFDITPLSYENLTGAIIKKDPKRFLFTGEFFPEEGKYHWTGHRNCNVSLSPKDALKLNNKCPMCKRNLTVGVLQRVEELADREDGFVPEDAIPFKSLLPLYEIISFVTGVNQLYSKKVIEEQNKLIDRFGNELNVLLNITKEELKKVTSEEIADAIIKVREGKVRFHAGYDGNYGIPIFDNTTLVKQSFVDQKSLTDFK